MRKLSLEEWKEVAEKTPAGCPPGTPAGLAGSP